MIELHWFDIEKEQPEIGRWIFYVDTKTAGYYDRRGWFNIAADDIDKGEYQEVNRVQWHYDMEYEEFKYWYPIPKLVR